ncbi:squamous cell carcinoma antigen recognized by T-cells 3 isoform X1 [Zeugodacus cucurbitae]|uniref:squamous cell carcinoma antigen recognized by T-cells 3 isoform X1 n=1 Tax=Zeugodacus cucurbitae TaxID=28588 RepID=UPI0023D8F066|nr:squamous cell carcinoma antigen recognized by T-cells 3 isoform X1 [Zeugodacus cucurbitae]
MSVSNENAQTKAKERIAEIGEIDEAEEEALLKSDDEYDAVRTKVQPAIGTLAPPAAILTDEDSLMNEAAQLQDGTVGIDDAGLSDEDIVLAEPAEAAVGQKMEDGLSEDSDDDDDDNEMDVAENALSAYKKLCKELDVHIYAYDKYIQLCELAHTTDDLDIIRAAYSRFSAVYPLSQELWLKYLSIEMNVALSPKEIEFVEGLFRKALADYYSTAIALEFASLAPRCAEPEKIWLELLGTYGLHCLEGQLFFKLYREYLSNHAAMSAEAKQEAYIKSYLQELKYPLFNMEESYIEFKVFYEKNKEHITHEISWDLLDKNYFKAKEHQHQILPFEHKLKAIDVKCYRERAEVFINYIKESDKFLDENVLQTVYERMVAACCLNIDCWLTYIDFLIYRDAYGRPEELQDLPVFRQTAVDVNKRALRNCPWAEKLYVKHMLLLEQLDKSREEVQEVLENAMIAGFQQAEPAVTVWMEYLTYLRRHTNYEHDDECDILRKNFNLAWTILGQQWGVLADCNCEILQLWGRLEYGPLEDPKRGKELWTTAMESADNATRSGLWIEFAQLELRRDLEATRKLYRKALHSPGLDDPMVIVSAWERFERCNGTSKTLTNCIKECAEFKTQYRTENSPIKTDSTAANKANRGSKRKNIAATEFTAPEKKAKSETLKKVVKPTGKGGGGGGGVSTDVPGPKRMETGTFKEHENQEIDLTKDHLRIFLSNLDYSLKEDDIRANLPNLKIVNVQLIRSANGKSRGFGYVELESAFEVEKALAMDRISVNGRPLFISSVLRDKEKRQKFKYSDDVEPRKLFVKSLPSDTTKEELEQMFGAFGKLRDVRLVYHKSGKFKNIAYIEYQDESAAGKAVLATDQLELRSHIITVAISAPPPKPATSTVITASKLLGINKKQNKAFEQKPRMSLIPTVVRKKFTATQDSNATSAASSKATNGASLSKTNEDFRKLLLK